MSIFASGAKGRKFESYRAYQSSLKNQVLSATTVSLNGRSNVCQARISDISDYQLTRRGKRSNSPGKPEVCA